MQGDIDVIGLKEVAAWQIRLEGKNDKDEEYKGCYRKVVLPALQRGAVWKPHQVEYIWDSILRGFPIGSFLKTNKFVKGLGIKQFTHNQNLNNTQSQNNKKKPGSHLLDGQQRTNAIALAFLDGWTKDQTKSSKDPSALLWIDLAPPKETGEENRKYIFRLVTRSHPWGYRRQDPKRTMPAAKRREAFNAFLKIARHANDEDQYRPLDIPLRYAWPWDANVPVPFPLLVKAIEEGKKIECWQDLEDLLKRNPLWKYYFSKSAPSGSNIEPDQKLREKIEELKQLKRDEEILKDLRENVRKMLDMKIPVLETDVSDGDEDKPAEKEDDDNSLRKNDRIEELFIRLNAGGTELKGEELIYSILKSVYPEAHELVENLNYKVMAPSRLVLLTARLVRMKVLGENQKENVWPSTPGVADFRRWIRDNNFLKEMKRYVKYRMPKLIKESIKLLRLKDDSKEEDVRLPAILVSEMAQRSPDIFFMFLAWLDRVVGENEEMNSEISDERRCMIGALTTLHWFAIDKNQCAQAVWKDRREYLSEGFWVDGVLRNCLKRPNGKILIVPPLCPDVLKGAIDAAIQKPDIWEKWDWYKNFINNYKDVLVVLESFWDIFVDLEAEDEEDKEKKLAEIIHVWWQQIADKKMLLFNRSLLLYAQRHWLQGWFPDYDPSKPEYMEDTSRPWDYDHIHPSYYVAGRRWIPKIIRHWWHGSIGNLRAWPAEANRSDNRDTPKNKLTEPGEEEKRYKMRSQDHILKASLIEKNELEFWNNATPENDTKQYLARNEYDKERDALLKAITCRAVSVYRAWYEPLEIEKLFFSDRTAD